MPSKYSDAQKQEAMEMLKIGDEIAFVHYSTGIAKRTLRSWRKQLTDQSNGQMAEKNYFYGGNLAICSEHPYRS